MGDASGGVSAESWSMGVCSLGGYDTGQAEESCAENMKARSTARAAIVCRFASRYVPKAM